MIEVLHSNFIRTARAKDYRCAECIFRHAFGLRCCRFLSIGPAFVGIITGSMVIEERFALTPGIGRLFVNGALNRVTRWC